MQKIEKILYKNKKWILLVLSSILFFEIFENLLQNEIWILDSLVYYVIEKGITPIVTKIAKGITLCGSAYVMIPVCFITTFIGMKKKWGKYIPMNLLIIFLSNQLLKRIVARPRPEGFRLVEESGYSFPSGHSMVSMAFYGFFIYLIYKKVKNPYIKWSAISLLLILVILIGLSRIYLGVHYASDVFAGFCLSIAYLVLFTHLIEDKIEG